VLVIQQEIVLEAHQCKVKEQLELGERQDLPMATAEAEV
jgi:hypothetical protein